MSLENMLETVDPNICVGVVGGGEGGIIALFYRRKRM